MNTTTQHLHVPFYIRKPGYWRCRRILNRLRKFQDLVRHQERWGYDLDNAQPLEALLPKGTDTSPANAHQVSQLIEKQINRLIPLVQFDLTVTGINTGASIRVNDDPEQWRDINLVSSYLDQLPPEVPRNRRYELLMQCLERNIGWFEERQRRATWDAVNPLHWLAQVARLPITVLEMAGLVPTQKEHSQFVTVYVWLLRFVFLLILVFAATKLGISIPWKWINIP